MTAGEDKSTRCVNAGNGRHGSGTLIYNAATAGRMMIASPEKGYIFTKLLEKWGRARRQNARRTVLCTVDHHGYYSIHLANRR